MSTKNPENAVDHRAWGARFGWIVGAIAGLALGLLATWLVERHILQGATANPAETAGKFSAILLPSLFLVGALGGHAYGEASGPVRYRVLGIATGLSLLVFVWFSISVAR